MGYPLAPIGPPTARGEQIAAGAIERLRGAARRPPRDLQRLAAVWSSPNSCFRKAKDHAAPTLLGIETVLPHLGGNREDVVQAAFSALWSAARVCERGAYEHLPGTIWDLPGTVAALKSSFGGSATSRLAAARFVCGFPNMTSEPLLRAHLGDTIYTVRWYCAQALAQLSQLDGLVAVLVASAPRDLDLQAKEPWSTGSLHTYHAAGFWAAVRELGPSAEYVVQALRERPIVSK